MSRPGVEWMCTGEMQGSARIIGCFQENRNQLSFECKAALFDQEQQMAEDIDFLVPLKVDILLPMVLPCSVVMLGTM